MVSKRTIAVLVAFGLLVFCARCGAAEWFDLNDEALATFDFEKMSLPTSVAELKREFPTARRVDRSVDEEIGLARYEVRDLENVDAARFYFCDGQLYQFEVEYHGERLEKLDGVQAVLQKLIDRWGPADHAGQFRWSWYRPVYKRRADFFSWPGRAQLMITDMTWMPVVERRFQRQDAKARLDLGI